MSSTATSAAPGTLSCALLDGPADGDAAFVAICFALGEMLYFSSSEDATGEGRMQLIDSNWVVCSQNVGPGATVTEDLNVILYVVTDVETCP